MRHNESDLKMRQLNFSKLRAALKDIENQASYYIGGTLCIDFADMPCVGLNLNGRGFSYRPESGTLTQTTFVLPNNMVKIVQDLYLKHKGRTGHYESAIQK